MADADAICAEARELQKAGEIDAALARFDDGLAIDSRHRDLLFRKASCLRAKKRDYKAALALYDQAIEVDGDYEWSWFQRGLCREKLRDYEAGLADVDRAIELRSEFPAAWRARLRLLGELKRFADALECTEHFDIAEADPATRLEVARSLVELERGADALELLERRLARSIDEWVVSLKIRALIGAGRIDDAQTCYDDHAELCGGDPDFDRCKRRLREAREA